MALLLAMLAACGRSGPVESTGDPDPGTPRTTGPVPLTDMQPHDRYLGFQGGLYPDGRNEIPGDHESVGRARARAVVPLDVNGSPAPDGRYVLLSVGMSNTTQEFCAANRAFPCDAWTFAGQAERDPAVNRTTLAIVNGAMGGQSAESWDQPTDANYDRVRDQVLARLGLSEKQVQVVWIKQARPNPRASLPDPGADAYALEVALGNTVRALRVRYPNLRQVFLSSRIYAGYATTALNPEPYAYQSGFAVKWLVQSQIEQARGAAADARAGELDHRLGAPWLGWGPYLWADGMRPRADGLVWEPGDFDADGTHPSRAGEEKVGRLLLAFFKSSPVTRCWFLVGGSC